MHETPELAAHRLAADAINDGFKFEALHAYQDAEGRSVYWRIRAKHPDGHKWIRPMYLNGQGYELGEPDFGCGKPFYRLPEIINPPDKALWFVEGEWSADHLARLGVLSTTSGGSTSANKADFAPLTKRHINIWPDNDEGGLRHAAEVAEKLIAVGAAVRLVDIKKLNLAPKGDCIDWLEEHPQA